MANSQLQELVNYIKKAREAGQQDQQTQQILLKNGWSELETNEAFASIPAVAQKPQPQPQPQVQAQPQVQPSAQVQPQQTQPPVETARPQYQPQAQVQTQPQAQVMTNKKSRNGGGSHFVLGLFIFLVVLAILGVGGYFAAVTFLPQPTATPVDQTVGNTENDEEQPIQPNLTTAKLTAVLQDYDISKIIVASTFSRTADKVAYCAPKKIGGKIDCFLNDEKLGNSYSYKPYWIGVSPNGERVVFLYWDSVKKQSFIFENGVEGARYDGTMISPKFSDDGFGLIYVVAGNDNKSFAVLNDIAFAPHDKIFGVPQLSSDGKYLLYSARDGQDLFWMADEVKP